MSPAVKWEENFVDVPADHAMIEAVLIFKRRMERSLFFRWRTMYLLHRVGCFPLPA